ncbi:MAG: hypothetical protein V3G42_10985 [Oscillospiraceae bacterium]
MGDMSYRDKMMLLIISIIVVLVAGFFALIKPKYQALVADKAVYESTKADADDVQRKLDEIKPLQDSIKEAYQKAKATAQVFVNTAFEDENNSFTVDDARFHVEQYIQPTIDESNLKVNDFAVSAPVAQTVEYYYYSPNVVTYSLLEAADVNGNYSTKLADAIQAESLLNEKQMAEVMVTNVEISATGKREDILTFVDKIKEDTNAITITELEIDDYTFSGGLESTTREEVNPETGEVTVITEGPTSTDGDSEVEIAVSFYNAKEIDEPVLDK